MKTDISIIENKKEELQSAFFEIFQGRSDFQLEKFVVEYHWTSERQYAQCVLELQNKYYNIKRNDIQRRKLMQEIENEKCSFTLEEKKLDLEQLEISLLGDFREFQTLYSIFKQFPKFTNDQLQAAEEKYWHQRLSTQAQQDIEAQGTISVGNADALRQAKILNGYSERFYDNVKQHPGFQGLKLDIIKKLKEK